MVNLLNYASNNIRFFIAWLSCHNFTVFSNQSIHTFSFHVHPLKYTQREAMADTKYPHCPHQACYSLSLILYKSIVPKCQNSEIAISVYKNEISITKIFYCNRDIFLHLQGYRDRTEDNIYLNYSYLSSISLQSQNKYWFINLHSIIDLFHEAEN